MRNPCGVNLLCIQRRNFGKTGGMALCLALIIHLSFLHGQDLDPKFYTQKYLKIAKYAHFAFNIDNIEYFVHLTDLLHGRFPWRPRQI